MKPHDIEYWALRIIERVESGQPSEDTRVELKSVWPDPVKSARQIAGHANSARGEPILWLIGVDEKQGVLGAKYEELTDWYAQVKTQFDGVVPAVLSVNVHVRHKTGMKTVGALLFETGGAPFVVKNQAHGQPGGGPVSLEVPWREGTGTRSAYRGDLLRILVPLQRLPTFELLEADMSVCGKDTEGGFPWALYLQVYLAPAPGSRVVIPYHRCHAWMKLEAFGSIQYDRVSLNAAAPERSRFAVASYSGIHMTGPELLSLGAYLRTKEVPSILPDRVEIGAELFVVDGEEYITISDRLTRSPAEQPGSPYICRWSLKK